MKNYLLVEPINKSPYPPIGLMRISKMLKSKKDCKVMEHFGMEDPPLSIGKPYAIYVTTLFTWEASKVIQKINRLKYLYPSSNIFIGGIAASLLPDLFYKMTGIMPLVGLHQEAEQFSPDYSITFGRKLDTSITSTTRGCNNGCSFCCVHALEGKLRKRTQWEQDINTEFNRITLWDNNILDIPGLDVIVKKLKSFGKTIDFNQGLDARLYNAKTAKILHLLNIDPIRFAYDGPSQEKDILDAIRLSRNYSNKEVRIYTLYNYKESPQEYYERINTLNKEHALIYPMKYRNMAQDLITPPNKKWDDKLLRAFGLSLRFYYKRGIITDNREVFLKIYGRSPNDFIRKLYDIYEYDKTIKKKNINKRPSHA